MIRENRVRSCCENIRNNTLAIKAFEPTMTLPTGAPKPFDRHTYTTQLEQTDQTKRSEVLFEKTIPGNEQGKIT